MAQVYSWPQNGSDTTTTNPPSKIKDPSSVVNLVRTTLALRTIR